MFKEILAGCAMVMMCCSMSAGQSPLAEENNAQTNLMDLSLIGKKTVEPGKYWLGIWCSTLPPALRTQLELPKQQGVLVEGVAPDSPAAKAGVARFDILLRVGEKPLSDPRDLVAAIEAAKETAVKLELIRDGKPKTIEVIPAKRLSEQAMTEDQPGESDWKTVEKWMQGMWPGGDSDSQRPPMRFRMFHPGAIVPPSMSPLAKLPENMSISVSKQGDQPAKIVVKRGEENWELTEKELDKLPADVRPYVERMLGRGPLGIVGGTDTFDFVPEMASPEMPEGPGHSGGGAWQERMESRLNELNGRMEKMMKRMEEIYGGRGKATEKPADEPVPKTL